MDVRAFLLVAILAAMAIFGWGLAIGVLVGRLA
jgi:hypothetical protein